MTSTLSKLVSYPNYLDELKYNRDFIRLACRVHLKTLANLSVFKEQPSSHPYINYRIDDMSVAITDDVLRYSSYHRIEKKESDERTIYDAGKYIRAAIFLKWTMKMRPCTLDSLRVSDTPYECTSEESIDVYSEEKQIEWCNEHLAIHAANIILGSDSNDENIDFDINEIIGNRREMSSLFYSLRYRLTHQDSFIALMYRIETQSDATD